MAPIISVGLDTTESTAEQRARGAVVLVQIELKAYGGNPATTLRLANREFVDADNLPWDAVLPEEPSIDHGGRYLQTAFAPVVADVVAFNRRLTGQALTEKLAHLFASYDFTGARLWIRQAFTGLTSTSSYPTLFDGVIDEWPTLTALSVRFHAAQDPGYDVTLPVRKVDLDEYPNAPTPIIGTPIPLVLGDWSQGRYLKAGNGLSYPATYAGIARGAVPLLPIDAPTAAGLVYPKVLISDDPVDPGIAPDGTPYNEVYLFEQGANALAGPSAATFDATGPSTLALQGNQFVVSLAPIAIDPLNTALGAQECFRRDKGLDLAGFATLDRATSYRKLALIMGDQTSLGTFIKAQVLVFFAKNAWSPTLGSFGATNNLAVTSQTTAFQAGATTFPSAGFQTMAVLDLPSNVCGKWEDIKDLTLTSVVSAGTQQLSVYLMRLLVTYDAAPRVETPGVQRTGSVGKRVQLAGRSYSGDGDYTSGWRRTANTSTPDLVSFDQPLFGYPRGPLDDITGTYTGTPGALIQHPVDLARYLLRTKGGVSSGQIVEGAGDYGSFADAKTALTSYKFRALITQARPLSEHLSAIGGEALCWFVRKATEPGAPFAAVPWGAAASNYRSASDVFTFEKLKNWMVQGTFSAYRTPSRDVANNLRVNYDWDPRTNTYGQSIYITDTGSRVPFGFFGLFTTDPTREAAALDSVNRLGGGTVGRREQVVNLQFVRDDLTAGSILARLFDLRVTPRVGIRFDTYVQAYDLERGHVFPVGADWDDAVPCPVPGGGGTWAGHVFRVVNLRRNKDRPNTYSVQAVEA